ncbi:Similar to hts: Protein hu-li tai shao (Drosophila melanogaster) [Cotesia congregata]|uniref:Similar to hts: Protein hu-li tai shao (Drosophila melanogaster) n=1 Tax=Cotesia congregata TaxID=51543 RepID=A0A8J2H902_COTCN|nr:Similar to hts: Protein hu-li tai shao (Drosophila melanogaster) [Cotesia congregata]
MLHTAFIVNTINQAFMKAVVKKSNCILDYELNEALLTERGPRMADTSQHELSEPHTNGVIDGLTEEEKSKMRPADIDADMREMERRKRVEIIMNSKMFKEELERIIETQLKDGSGPCGLLQQITEMMGAQGARFNANVFKNSNCVVPINDIRGVEAKGYERGEKLLRCKLAAVFRLLDLYGWTQGLAGQITARLNADEEHFLVNPFGLLYHEITASSLVKVDMQGQVVEQGTTNFGVHVAEFQLHSTIHAARPDIKCIIHITTPTVTAVSSLKCGLLPIGPESIVIGDVSIHQYIGETVEPEEREKISRNLGPINKVMLLTNRGALCCGETIEEAFYNVYNTVLACETQLKLMPMGVENLNLLSEESKKSIYEASRKPPIPHTSSIIEPSPLAEKLEKRWRIGSSEFEALMRMLDNAGFRTGYIYRHPLIKSEPPRPRNDVEVPPAVSSLGYLLEEEELYKQGLWKGGRKGADRSRWLNSPNVYQKVEILETGTPDPKKITKWVSDGSPTHSSSTPVRIDSALQFVPKNTNPKEFKQLQQQIKDYRRADKISAGPQSHILEGVSWEEAKKMQDATISGTGEQVVLVGAASKGIIQRNFQHNAMVYKTPYAKNPFDAITDQELDQYKKEVERKTKGDIYDESQSESEALSSFNISRATHESSTAKSPIQSPISVTSETEEESRDEPRVLRIETKRVPKPSQAEVVLSDDYEASSNDEGNEEIPVGDYGRWRLDAHEEIHLERTKLITLTPLKSLNPQSKSLDNLNIFGVSSPKYKSTYPNLNSRIKSYRRRIFFDQYDKVYAQYKNSNLTSQVSQSVSNVNLNFINTNRGQSSVKQLISKYSSLALTGRNINDNTENNININTGLIKSRKRAYVPLASSSCSVCKLPRLSLPVLKLQDLQSPRLVEEAMNRQLLSETCVETESHLKECELRPVPVDLRVSPISMSPFYQFGEVQYESTPIKDVQVSKDCLPTAGSFEFVNADVNVSEADVNGNVANPLSMTSSGEKLVSDQEPSSEDVASVQTVVEKNLDCVVTNEKNLITETESISPELIDNLEWFNEPLDSLESSFAKELNDSQPWRFSSPLVSGKKYQREDSMTEVIDSINVNLTPSKSMRSLNFHLPSSDASMKYNLNSSHMSVIYSLTPTAEIQDGEEGNEHIYCGKKCPQCLILAPIESLSPTDHDSFYIWDDPIAEDEEKEDNVVDLNKTIDLFDNSIELEANVTHESADFELPEIKVEDEGEFHKDIETTVNEIIEGLEERATLIEANRLVDNVIDSACIEVNAVKSLEDQARFDGNENAQHDVKNEVEAALGNEEADIADNEERTRGGKEEIDFVGEVACKVEDNSNVDDVDIKKDISSVEEDGIGTERIVIKEEADSEIKDDDDFGILENLFEEESKPEVYAESHPEEANTEEQIDPEEVKEEISEIIHKISFNEDSEENIADKYTVVDEIIHHIIDKDSSNSSEQALERQDSHESQEESPRDTSESSESFNLKKVKENANTEIKEMQSQQESSLKIVDENVECRESKEDFINKLKAITEDVNSLDESRIKEIFFSGVINDLHLNPDGKLTAAESSEILQKLKCIVEQVNVDESSKALDGLETSNGDSTYSYALKQFKNQVEEIFKNSQASLTELDVDDVNIDNTAGKEIDSMEVDGHCEEDIAVNSSEQNEESEREEMSVDNTKSDDSKEKNEVTGKTVKFCIIEYQSEVSSGQEVQNEVDEAEKVQETGAQSSDGRESSESDESDSLVKNLSDGEKEALKLWEMAESEIERSYNGNISTTFVEYDHVDDILDTVDAKPLVHYPTHHDLRLDCLDEALNVSITRCKDKISLSTISEDDESESESEDEVCFNSSPIRNINSPMKITKVDSVCSLELIQEIDEDDIDIDKVVPDVNAKPEDVSDDDSDSVVIMSIKNIFREDDDLKIIYENVNNDIYHDDDDDDDDDINIIRETVFNKPVSDLDENHCSIENVNELKQTSSSLTEFHSCQEELSNPESFETCISHQSAQTITPRSDNNEVNSETYTISDNDADDDCTSEIVGIPHDTMYNADVSSENTVNGDHSDAHHSTFSHSSKEVELLHVHEGFVCSLVGTFHVKGSMSQDVSVSEESPKKEKKKKKGLRTPSFLKKKKEKKKSVEA